MVELDIKNKEELNKIYQSLSNFSTESQYYDYVKKLSVQNNIDYRYLLQKIRQMSIEKNYSGQKDLVKHFHATSFESFEEIIKTGELLSRSERKKRGISVENLLGSSSDNVQFSRDYFNDKGDLIKSGLGNGKGATGTEVVFVFGNQIYNEETFDATFHYPTVEKLNIKNACIAVIGANDDIVSKIRDLLKQYDCDEISVFSSNTWNNEISLSQLETTKKTKEHNKLAMKNYMKTRIKSLTKIQIEDNKGYIGEGILVLKSKQELLEEKEKVIEKIEELDLNNVIDTKEKNMLIDFIKEDYKNMILKAPNESYSISNQNNNQYEQANNQLNNNEVQSNIKTSQEEMIDDVPHEFKKIYDMIFNETLIRNMREKYGYSEMSDEEKEFFDDKIENTMAKTRYEERKKGEDSLADSRKEAWERLRMRLLSEPMLDLETLIRQEEFGQIENEQVDVVESVDKSIISR